MQKINTGLYALLLISGFLFMNSCKKPPHACFSPSSTNTYVEQTDTFTNCTQDAKSYKWNFGDSDSDFTDKSLTHVYHQPGTYKVLLVATGSNSASNSLSQNVVVSLPDITSANYIGTYTGTQSCSLTGDSTSNITIVANGYLNIRISNLYNTTGIANASITGNTATIPPQIFDTPSGKILLQGTMTLAGTTISIDLIATGFGKRDECQVVYIKQ
ncbi:MAG: hypothetical protein JWO06_4074 [Bacteroidota bacterium]|nr:hypothetical protein [Bacteroidota bacterium]